MCGISDGLAAFLVGEKPRGLNSGRGEKTALVRIFVTWFIAIQFSRFGARWSLPFWIDRLAVSRSLIFILQI